MKKTLTKGNVIVEDIKIGDIHYEFEYGFYIKSEVLTEPKRNKDGYWTWTSRNTLTEQLIDYGVREDMAHYGPNLYDNMAYEGCKQI